MTTTTYTVVCMHPDGGNVIEGRAKPVTESYSDPWEAFDAAARWHRPGPNGPVRTAEVYRDGVRVAAHDLVQGPRELVRLEPYRLSDGLWWHCRAVRPNGETLAASDGPMITRADAEAAGLRWAAREGFEAIV